MEKVYHHSGKLSIFDLMSVLGLGAVSAIFLGFVYNIFITLIPIIYINFFITVGFGTALGYGAKYLSLFGSVRNRKYIILLASIIGFVGFYFQWIAYLVFLSSGKHSFEAYWENLHLFYNPFSVFSIISEINVTGTWSIYDIPVNGTALWLVWLGEAIIIIGIPLLISIKHPITPYSELLGRWYQKYVLKYEFGHIAAQNQFKKDLAQHTAQTIENLSYGQPYRFSKVTVHYLKDEEKQYLSVDNMVIEDRGKGKHVASPVIHLWEISSETAKGLMKKYGAKKLFSLGY